MRLIFIFFFLFYLTTAFGQIPFYQDIYKGGATGDGFNVGNTSSIFQFNIQIPLNSTIRKAFLFCSVTNELENKNIIFQNQIMNVQSFTKLNATYNMDLGPFLTDIYTIYKDVTHLISNTSNTYNIQTPTNQEIISQGVGGEFDTYYLIVLYENLNYLPISINIFQNIQNTAYEMIYNIININEIDPNYPVGLALKTSDFCDTINDGSNVFINDIGIGILGGQEYNSNTFCSGTIGSFYYENNLLGGLGNDTSNDIMSGTDGLANINIYLNNSFSFDVKFNYQNPNGAINSNPIHQLFLVYTTPCQAFTVTSPPDTLICQNSTLQLSASGGQRYEWLPATGLSCSDCPNPIFTADSSMFYTVRIWNNDSCSVVRPLKINVRLQPVFSAISATKTECGTSTGSVTASSLVQGASYSLDGGAVQSSGFFENLPAGAYTLTLHDANGCTNDTLITIEDTVTVSAQFSINPSSGAAPLTVQITNESQHATDYEWFVNGASTGSATFTNYTFDTSGIYEIMLYAWQNNPSCIDSFSITVQVFDSLMVEIPNVFTPNNDGINDVFGITVNLPTTVNYRIFNRWGNEMKSGNGVAQKGIFVELWSSDDASEGVYFYQLELLPIGGEKVNMSGFFELRK